MLILAQIHSRATSDILSKILSGRSVRRLQSSGLSLEDENAEKLRDILSSHLDSLNLTHRVSIYATREDPLLMFLNIMEPFPPEWTSRLVSILATQEITPPIPPKNNIFIGDL